MSKSKAIILPLQGSKAWLCHAWAVGKTQAPAEAASASDKGSKQAQTMGDKLKSKMNKVDCPLPL